VWPADAGVGRPVLGGDGNRPGDAHALPGPPAPPVQPRPHDGLRAPRRAGRPARRDGLWVRPGRDQPRQGVRGVTGLAVGALIFGAGVGYLHRGTRASLPVSVPWIARAFGGVSRVLTRRIDRLTGSAGVLALGGVHAAVPCPIIYPAYLYAFPIANPVRGGLRSRYWARDDPDAFRLPDDAGVGERRQARRPAPGSRAHVRGSRVHPALARALGARLSCA